jgi:hypothetical protein
VGGLKAGSVLSRPLMGTSPLVQSGFLDGLLCEFCDSPKD